ncbi:MAG: anthranilate synthase component II [Fibrobacterota bacterium]
MILLLDNYDSFTYNLAHAVREITGEEIDIIRNDEISLEQAGKYDTFILSPGPGLPADAGILEDLIRAYCDSRNILGVCLGCQAISEVYGARLKNLDTVYHGVATPVTVDDPEEALFEEVDSPFAAGRYHSWVIDESTLHEPLRVTSRDGQGQVMGIRHVRRNVRGVQFHPESILTPTGEQMIRNFLKISNEIEE